MEPENFVDPIDFLRALDAKDVRCLLIGRQAVVQYGAPLQSFDFDFFMSPEASDLERLLSVARAMGLEVEPSDDSPSPPFLRLHADNVSFDFWRARSYTNMEGTVLDFEEMWARRKRVEDADLRLNLACIEDLVASKKMRDSSSPGGIKDREDLRYLSAIVDRFEKP